MLFTQPIFLAFFAVVFALHWAIPSNAIRKRLLLVASYVFYAAWDWRFLFLIFASTLIDYVVGLMLGKKDVKGGRRFWLIASLVGNLGILGFFKYYEFFATSAGDLLSWLGIPSSDLSLGIILPVGISFFTFQSMSYTIDIYRGILKPIKSFTDFALFVSFFPQLVAGPIVRARTFLPQLAFDRYLRAVPFKQAICLFMIGFFKKAVVADNLAVFVDLVYGDPEAYGMLSIWIAVILFSIQVYCDFSGYSDMAIAIARLLGFELCVNFSFPLLAGNFQDFWRRWHISLSTWLRDYLYFPLGGNRSGRFGMFRNLWITMVLSGLWHGASWNFIIWGAMHGFALIAHRAYRDWSEGKEGIRAVTRLLGWPSTFIGIAILLIYFRAPTLATAVRLTTGLVVPNAAAHAALNPLLLATLLPLGAVHVFGYRKPIEDRVQVLPNAVCAVAFGLAVGLMLLFIPLQFRPFVYFQF